MNLNHNQNILITGVAGFIGFHLARAILREGGCVVGLDNLNEYYSVELKRTRLDILQQSINFHFIRADLHDETAVNKLFESFSPTVVINLAAQVGVRYSLSNPRAYIDSNIIGFFNILEACRKYKVHNLLFASSSSVYGNSKSVPFSLSLPVNRPISLYAATKITNEVMAYTYSHLYDISTIGMRFFTVYGSFGRPDMAYFKWADCIISGKTIQVYNQGDMWRDFTYIDDLVCCIKKILTHTLYCSTNKYKIYNIGTGKTIKIMDLINVLERKLGKKATIQFLSMQPGDVYKTFADITDLRRDFNFQPSTTLEEGIGQFVKWYMAYREKSNEENLSSK